MAPRVWAVQRQAVRTEPRPNVFLGQVLRRLREERGLSQDELATAAQISRNHIGLIERAERNPTWNNIAQIAAALGVTLTQIASRYDRARTRYAKLDQP